MRLLAAILLILLPAGAFAQTPCPQGTPPGSVGCQQAAQTPLPTDLVLGWQIEATPKHTVAFTLAQIASIVGTQPLSMGNNMLSAGNVNLSGGTISGLSGTLGNIIFQATTGGWSSFNLSEGAVLTASGVNTALGMTDAAGANPWALWDSGANGMQLSTMPVLTNSTTPPTTIQTWTSSGTQLSVPLSISTSSAAPSAPPSGGKLWCDTSNVCYVSTPAYPNGFPIAGQRYNSDAATFWHIVTGGIGFGFGDPAAPSNEYSVLRSQKNVTGSGGGGLENNIVAATNVSGNGYLVQLEQQATQGTSSIVTSIATIANGTTLSAPGLAVGTTVASTIQNSPFAGLMTINLSAPTVKPMYPTAQGAPMQIAYGSSSATEDENTVLSTCKTWQVSGGTCVAGFFAAERFNPLGPTPFPLDIVATDNTGYGSQTSGSLGGECDVNASGPDNRTYAASGIATSAVGVRRCINVIATSMGPSVEGPSEIADGFNFQIASPVYSNDPVTLDHAVRCMGIVGWGNISSCMTSDGSALGQNVVSLTPGFRTQVLHAAASSGQNQIVFSSQAPATTGQIVTDSQSCIPTGSYVGTVQEGTTVPNTIVNLVQADGVTASNLTCNATALDEVTVTNRYASVAAGIGVFTDAFLDLANQGAPGQIKFGTTNNSGTVGKLSFMGQDSTGSTVDYGDLTGSVITNTHGATRGQLQSNTEMQITATLPGATQDAGLSIVTTPIGSGVNGPATAQFGLNITHEKQNWATTSQVGEIDGANILVRQGGPGSDAGGLLVNIQGTGQGFIAQSEMVSSIYNTGSSSITQEVDTQLGALSQSAGTYYGLVATANVGALTDGILIQDSGGTTSWANAFTNMRNGSINFNVSGAGAVSATSFALYGNTFSTGGDTTNGAIQIGKPSGAGTPYINFFGNSDANYSARIINDADGRLSIVGANGAAGTLNMAAAGSIRNVGLLAMSGPVVLASYTVLTLPTCNSAAKGELAFVTDATSPTYNGALTGGGAAEVPVSCNGTSWTAH